MPLDERRWAKVASVVGGEIFNCYSCTDWVLGLMYRTANLRVCVGSLLRFSQRFGLRRMLYYRLGNDSFIDCGLTGTHEQLRVAGLEPVLGIPNVHNINLTSDPDLDIDLVYGHDDYVLNLHAILHKIGAYGLY